MKKQFVLAAIAICFAAGSVSATAAKPCAHSLRCENVKNAEMCSPHSDAVFQIYSMQEASAVVMAESHAVTATADVHVPLKQRTPMVAFAVLMGIGCFRRDPGDEQESTAGGGSTTDVTNSTTETTTAAPPADMPTVVGQYLTTATTGAADVRETAIKTGDGLLTELDGITAPAGLSAPATALFNLGIAAAKGAVENGVTACLEAYEKSQADNK